MEELSDDILIDILSRVPATTLARVRRTNKRWHALISHPSFVKLHLERSRADPRATSREILRINSDYGQDPWKGMRPVRIESANLEGRSLDEAVTRLHDPTSLWPREQIRCVGIRGSCDGLICLVSYSYFPLSVHRRWKISDRSIYLWNPSTSEFMELPDVLGRIPREYSFEVGVGLGYDCEADDYKVVIAYSDNNTRAPKSKTIVCIFTRETCKWKRVLIPDAPIVTRFSCDSVNLNSVVHWLAECDRGQAVTSKCIVSFDVAKEKFQELPIPEDNSSPVGIGVLDECLCLSNGYREHQWRGIDVWIMKEYGVKASWAKLLRVPFETIIGVPSTYMDNLLSVSIGKILVIKRRNFHFVMFYNVEEKSFRVLTDGDDRNVNCMAHVHQGSLVSPYPGDCASRRKRRLHPTEPYPGDRASQRKRRLHPAEPRY